MASLIIAYSGRALAAAAAKAGEPVHVIDWFADEDTQALAKTCLVAPPGQGGAGFRQGALDDALDQLRGRFDKIVYGAGIEGDPTQLTRLGRAGPIAGNSLSTLALVKDPLSLSALLAQIGAAHPEISLTPPDESGWLAKRVGGSGGGHISWADACFTQVATRQTGRYYQRAVAGEAISVLFAANGQDAVVLGFSEQWAAPTRTSPFRYGGCAGPVELGDATASVLADLCARLTAATGLVGLNGLDCLIAEDGTITVIEVNPRPGAAIDLFDQAKLWTIHIDAVAGQLPQPSHAVNARKRAAGVLYAETPMLMPNGFDWPHWAADQTPGGRAIPKAAPICTVFAEADLVSSARALLENRMRSLYKRLTDAGPHPRATLTDTSHTDPSVAV